MLFTFFFCFFFYTGAFIGGFLGGGVGGLLFSRELINGCSDWTCNKNKLFSILPIYNII